MAGVLRVKAAFRGSVMQRRERMGEKMGGRQREGRKKRGDR